MEAVACLTLGAQTVDNTR